MNSKALVDEKIRAANLWFTGSQFEWSFGPARFVHAHRQEFMERWIARCRQRIQHRPLRVVEVGCGDGVNIYRLRNERGCTFHGLDYNPLRLARATQLVPGTEFLNFDLADQSKCPVAGGAHVLLFSHVIEHIADDASALRKLRAWLAPGGVLLLLTPNEGCLFSQISRHVINPELKANTDHVHFYTRRKLKRLVRDAGFRILQMRGEVLHFPSYRHHMGLLRRGWGYTLLKIANFILPSQTAGWQLALEAQV